jgi:hypothetical protein
MVELLRKVKQDMRVPIEKLSKKNLRYITGGNGDCSLSNPGSASTGSGTGDPTKCCCDGTIVCCD